MSDSTESPVIQVTANADPVYNDGFTDGAIWAMSELAGGRTPDEILTRATRAVE